MSLSKPEPGSVVVTLAMVSGLLLFAMGVKVGGTTLLAISGLLIVISLFAIARINVVRATMASTCACVFFTGLEQVHIGPLRVRGALLIIALLFAALAQARDRLPPLPWWVWTLAFSVVLSTALLEMAPIAPAYFMHRFNEAGAAGLPAGASGSAARIVLTVLGIPTIVVVCCLRVPKAALAIGIAYVAGNSLSALAAYTDYLGITSLSSTFGGCGVSGSRACGFAAHPVLLTIGTVYATGLAAWFLVQSNLRYRIFGSTTLVMLLLGTYASGTRGGELSAIFAVVVSILLLPQYRRHIHIVVLSITLTVVVIAVAFPAFGNTILVKSRLLGDGGASGSNQGRIEAITQGWHDFLHSPVDGIGMGYLLQAHNGYVQSLASGGIIFFLAILAMQFGALTSAARLTKAEPFALALVVTALTRIIYDLLEGALVYSAAVVPVALTAGLLAQGRDWRASGRWESAPESVPAGSP